MGDSDSQEGSLQIFNACAPFQHRILLAAVTLCHSCHDLLLVLFQPADSLQLEIRAALEIPALGVVMIYDSCDQVTSLVGSLQCDDRLFLCGGFFLTFDVNGGTVISDSLMGNKGRGAFRSPVDAFLQILADPLSIVRRIIQGRTSCEPLVDVRDTVAQIPLLFGFHRGNDLLLVTA